MCRSFRPPQRIARRPLLTPAAAVAWRRRRCSSCARCTCTGV
jgi:hypothetical protein